jgi:hypothetical protein
VYCSASLSLALSPRYHSIRFRLQSEAEQLSAIQEEGGGAATVATVGRSSAAGGGGGRSGSLTVTRCQLLSRHWRVLDDKGAQQDEITGLL